MKGSEPDIERTAIYVLKDFREGRLGLFILDELPQDEDNCTCNHNN